MTTLIIITIAVAVWLACGAVGAGYYFAYYQRSYKGFSKRDFDRDKRFALDVIYTGPIGLIVAVNVSRTTCGWLWPWSAKARREAGIES